MKTLIFNGSPRAKGASSDIVAELRERLEEEGGEVWVLETYRSDIAPCVDCRYCWSHETCCVQDGMQEIYAYLEACDNVVVVSPIYFMELTGPLLSVLSRLQIYFAARRFQGRQLLSKEKQGAVVLVAGSKKDSFQGAYRTAKICLRELRATEILEQGFHNTDCVSVREQEDFAEKMQQIVSVLQGHKEEAEAEESNTEK